MPYPSPITYPSPSLFPGFTDPASDGQRIAFGDVVLGMWDTNGVKWSVKEFDGWDGSPGSTTQFTQRARDSGSTSSEGFFTTRYMTIKGLLYAPNLNALEDARDQMNAAVTLKPFQMVVSESNRVLNMMVKRQGEVIITPRSDQVAEYSILIAAKDPRKYGDLVSGSTLLPSSSGGRTYPATYPIIYTGVSNSGILRVRNEGKEQAPVWLRIDGPIPAGGWSVTHVAKKKSLAFTTSLALATGEFVTVDMDRKEILAQGQSPRAGYITSRGWFSLDPGDNDIAFSATNYSATARLTVTTKPAWS